MEETGINIVESNLSEKKWYHNLSLENVDAFILANMKSAVRSVIAIGYYLKCIRDDELYLEAGYTSVWDYASAKYGFSKSNAVRYMKRNDKFSVDGNSPILAEEYREYSKSQLQEMLSLDEEQLEQVTPDMTVKQIRELRKPAQKEIPYYEIPGQLSIFDPRELVGEDVNREEDVDKVPEGMPERAPFTMRAADFFAEPVPTAETGQETVVATSQRADSEEPEPLSAYGTLERVYPPDSLIATSGCEGGHDCFSCAMECRLRQEDRYCRQAPMGNPFPCTTMNVLELLREEMGDKCQFVNHDLAFHRQGDGEPDPCCEVCEELCGFRCGKSKAAAHPIVDEPEEEAVEECSAEPGEAKVYDREILEKMIQDEQEAFDMMSDYWREKQPWTYSKYRMRLDAFRMLMEFHDNEKETETEPEMSDSPELPPLRNNDQRKAWIQNYKAWGLWYRDENIDVNYYKYDFENDTRLIAVEYPQRPSLWSGEEKDEVHYHLLEKDKERYGRKVTYHEKFRQQTSSVTEIVEYLKKIQKE